MTANRIGQLAQGASEPTEGHQEEDNVSMPTSKEGAAQRLASKGVRVEADGDARDVIDHDGTELGTIYHIDWPGKGSGWEARRPHEVGIVNDYAFGFWRSAEEAAMALVDSPDLPGVLVDRSRVGDKEIMIRHVLSRTSNPWQIFVDRGHAASHPTEDSAWRAVHEIREYELL